MPGLGNTNKQPLPITHECNHNFHKHKQAYWIPCGCHLQPKVVQPALDVVSAMYDYYFYLSFLGSSDPNRWTMLHKLDDPLYLTLFTIAIYHRQSCGDLSFRWSCDTQLWLTLIILVPDEVHQLLLGLVKIESLALATELQREFSDALTLSITVVSEIWTAELTSSSIQVSLGQPCSSQINPKGSSISASSF